MFCQEEVDRQEIIRKNDFPKSLSQSDCPLMKKSRQVLTRDATMAWVIFNIALKIADLTLFPLPYRISIYMLRMFDDLRKTT